MDAPVRGDANYPLTYKGMHQRIHRARGKALDHRCVGCGNKAKEWALMDGRGRVLNGRRYSNDPDDYEPKCHPCHRNGDIGGDRHYGARLTWEQVDAIRSSSMTLTGLAQKYGVDRRTIKDVVTGHTWQK